MGLAHVADRVSEAQLPTRSKRCIGEPVLIALLRLDSIGNYSHTNEEYFLLFRHSTKIISKRGASELFLQMHTSFHELKNNHAIYSAHLVNVITRTFILTFCSHILVLTFNIL